MSDFRSSVSGQDEETRQLKSKVQRLESEKRDALEALNRKASDYERLQQDYDNVHQKAAETRKELSKLESQLQQAQSSQTQSKFKEQTLQHELQLLKNNNDWLESDVKSKTEELQKFRKEKNAQISSLQKELDEALSNAASEQKTNEALRERLAEVSQKNETFLQSIQELKEQAVIREESFRGEMETQQRLTRLYQEACESAKARVAELDRQVGEEQHRVSVEVGRLQEERKEREAAERKIMELEVQIERLEADIATLSSNQPAYPQNMGSPARPGTPMRNGGAATIPFSPAAARLQKAGISMTQLYADYNAAKTELDAERRRNDKLQHSFDELIHDLELRAPELEEQRIEHERLQEEMINLSHLLQQMTEERDKARRGNQKMEARIGTYEREGQLMKQRK